MKHSVARRIVEGLGIVVAAGAVGWLIAAVWPHRPSDETFSETAPAPERVLEPAF